MSLTKNQIKFIKSLHQKKQRDTHNQFIVEGEKMIKELLSQEHFTIKSLYHTTDYPTENISDTIEKFEVSSKDLERMTGFKKANKVLAIVDKKNTISANLNESNLILVLDDVNDPGNLGTILRTADWFGITQVFASKKTVELYNSKVIQSSMGAVFRINIHYTDLTQAISDLKSHDFCITGATLSGQNIYNTPMTTKTALVMGSESHGISDTLLSQLDLEVKIPNFGESESLNVAMATGILLSEYKR